MLSRYEPAHAYHRSKLAQVMTAFDLAGRLPTGVTINAIHPSTYMPTKLLADTMDPESSIAEGVNAVLALDPFDDCNGAYIRVNEPARAHSQAYSSTARRRLREASDHLLRAVLTLSSR